MGPLQTERIVAVDSTLAPDTLLFRSMVVSETLGRPFEIDLDLYSEDPEIAIEDVLGEAMLVTLETESGDPRYFHGIVTEFSQVETASARYAAYRATLRPWLWLLTRTSDCRIYRGTVPEIVQKVFRDNGFSDFDSRLQGTYKPRDYCVQYRETAFNFVSRLLEQEGICYYHEHDQQKHTLVMCDGYGSHQRIPGCETLPFYPRDRNRQRDREHISSLRLSRRVEPGLFVQRDFDFTRPTANLTADAALPREHAQSDFEMFDYPGDYVEKADGVRYSKFRIEELQTEYERVECESDAKELHAGGLFELTGFPRTDQNREYLILGTTIHLQTNQYESGNASEETTFSCTFSAIDSRETFRPPRITPKPLASGPQTAIVVGKSGEEIWTDEYGRVKVQFHWDRYGTFDENSSCWVRVSHAWAGKEWGSIYLPRMGQEVIVEFLEGDPDYPIITGRVYNGDNRPPYALPANKTVSTLLSRSSLGGSPANFNEIKFEDKKGQEEILIHAEKNLTQVVENDHSITVYHNRSVIIGSGGKASDPKSDGKVTESIFGDVSATIQKGDYSQTVSAGKSTTAVKGKISITSNSDGIAMTASTDITLTVGASSLTMKSDGTIDLKGVNVTVDGKTAANVKSIAVKIAGSATVDMSGSASVKISGAMIESGASGIHTIKGAMVKIN